MTFEEWLKEHSKAHAGRIGNPASDLRSCWNAAMATAEAICEEKIERDAEYQGGFGGYGAYKGDKTGPECAAEIRLHLA